MRHSGVDLDGSSIDKASERAQRAGVDDRVTFRVTEAAAPDLHGRFDAAFVFEALHDMARPVEVLAQIRAACTDAASVVIMDERVGDRFVAPADEVERFMYSASVLHWLSANRDCTYRARAASWCRR